MNGSQKINASASATSAGTIHQRHEANKLFGSSLFKQIHLHARHIHVRPHCVLVAELLDDERGEDARMRDDEPDAIMAFSCGLEQFCDVVRAKFRAKIVKRFFDEIAPLQVVVERRLTRLLIEEQKV